MPKVVNGLYLHKVVWYFHDHLSLRNVLYLHAVIWSLHGHLMRQGAFVCLPPIRFFEKQINVWSDLLQFHK